MDERERYRRGMDVRRAVLGEAYVRGALRNRTELTAEFQDLLTRYAWGEVWTDPGLPRSTRSLLVIAMMVALNRPDELRLHLRAALTNGATREEITEVMLQAAIYCGVPAANAAIHVAVEVLGEGDHPAPPRRAARPRPITRRTPKR